MNGPLINTDFESAAASWIQRNASEYVWPQIPWVLANGERNGFGNDTTYRLPVFEQFMGSGENGNLWRVGQELPGTRDLKDAPVTLSHLGRATDGLRVPEKREGKRHRMEDVERIVDGLMAESYLIREVALVNHLLNTSVYGAAASFSGTDPLKDKDSDDTQDPINDIEEALDPLNSIRQFGLELWCFGNRRIFDLLRRKPAYHGAGAQSGGGSGAGKAGIAEKSRQAFIEAFAGYHNIDKVCEFKVVTNSANRGASAAAGNVNGNAGFLQFCLVDTRNPRHDFTSAMPDPKRAPDGALVGVCEVWEPFVTDEASTNKEVRTYYGKDSFGYARPRSGDLAGGATWAKILSGNVES